MRRTKDSAEARVSVLFRSRQQMEAIAEALGPEVLHPAGEKAQARITKGGKMLELQFEGRDTSALRAIMTSYLRLLGAAVNVSDLLRQREIKSKSKRTRAERSRGSRDTQ